MTAQPARLATELPLLGLLALFWGSSYLFVGVAVHDIPPATLVAVRVTIAAILLSVILWLRGDRLPRDRRTWGMLLVQACCNSIISWTLLAWGQQYVDSSLAAVLNSTAPLWVLLITVLVTRHEHLGGRRLAGALLGICGVVLIVGTDALAGLGQQVAGQLAALFGAMLYGVGAIYGRRFGHISPLATATGTMIWAVAWMVPVSLAVDRPWTLQPGLPAIAAATALGLFCTGCAMMLYFRLVRTLGSLGVASQAYLRSGIGVMLGVVVLGETITPVVGLGLAAAILGVMLINVPFERLLRRRQPA
ncbi:MAG: EamA family transporter [Pseudomonadota bacterium]|nr:EamA family transporter [Pseudomonadota bacterium]